MNFAALCATCGLTHRGMSVAEYDEKLLDRCMVPELIAQSFRSTSKCEESLAKGTPIAVRGESCQ